eukprot:ctg_3684.g640
MGFNDQEIVALSGAHTIGRAFKFRSGFGAGEEGTKFTNRVQGVTKGGSSWTEEWLKFDNTYYTILIDPNADPELLKLPTDKALMEDPEFNAPEAERAGRQVGSAGRLPAVNGNGIGERERESARERKGSAPGESGNVGADMHERPQRNGCAERCCRWEPMHAGVIFGAGKACIWNCIFRRSGGRRAHRVVSICGGALAKARTLPRARAAFPDGRCAGAHPPLSVLAGVVPGFRLLCSQQASPLDQAPDLSHHVFHGEVQAARRALRVRPGSVLALDVGGMSAGEGLRGDAAAQSAHIAGGRRVCPGSGLHLRHARVPLDGRTGREAVRGVSEECGAVAGTGALREVDEGRRGAEGIQCHADEERHWIT